MAQETVRLAEYAAALRYEDLPAEIVRRAKECIADTVAAAICGASLPWSRLDPVTPSPDVTLGRSSICPCTASPAGSAVAAAVGAAFDTVCF